VTFDVRFEYTKWLIRRRKGERDRQYNGEKKKNTKGQIIMYKTLHRQL
jgi:hypothetical protein